MHLQLNYTTPEGDNYPACCVVITSIIVMPDVSMICTNWYADAAAWAAGDLPLQQPASQPDTTLFDAGPIFAVAYNYLLSLPPYASAILVDGVVH